MNVTDFERPLGLIERCRELVAAINESASRTGAHQAQTGWMTIHGAPVYAAPMEPEAVTTGFLAELPRRAHFFTGWPPEGAVPTRMGALAAALPAPLAARLFARFWHRLQRAPTYFAGLPLSAARRLAAWYEHRLPVSLRPGAAFDGTELDRLALVERLAAMHQLGVFRTLRRVERPVVLEIGAGYGLLAASLLRAFPGIQYRIVDLPSSLALSACYLTSRGHSGVQFALSTQLDRFDGKPIDLAINTLSFGEMPAATVDVYGAFIARNLAPGGRLFEQNFDNTHCEKQNFCDPAAALTLHLVCERESRGFWLKGRPRIWTVKP